MLWEAISNTWKSVSSDIQTLRSWLKNSAAPRFSNPLLSVWISDETFFLVFDILLTMPCYRITGQRIPYLILFKYLHRFPGWSYEEQCRVAGTGFPTRAWQIQRSMASAKASRHWRVQRQWIMPRCCKLHQWKESWVCRTGGNYEKADVRNMKF